MDGHTVRQLVTSAAILGWDIPKLTHRDIRTYYVHMSERSFVRSFIYLFFFGHLFLHIILFAAAIVVAVPAWCCWPGSLVAVEELLYYKCACARVLKSICEPFL